MYATSLLGINHELHEITYFLCPLSELFEGPINSIYAFSYISLPDSMPMELYCHKCGYTHTYYQDDDTNELKVRTP